MLIDQLIYLEIGPRLGRVLTKLTKEIGRMADNFDAMTAAVDRVAEEVRNVADAIANPSVDNNNQAVIDDLTGRLNAAADSLQAATEAEKAEDSGASSTGGFDVTSEEAPATEAPAASETPSA